MRFRIPSDIHREFTPHVGDGPIAPLASDPTDAIGSRRPAPRAHGHVHQAPDRAVGGARIDLNPLGCPDERTGFDPGLPIENP
jgi:hypothetical protein